MLATRVLYVAAVIKKVVEALQMQGQKQKLD